jgi:hypothetical protein
VQGKFAAGPLQFKRHETILFLGVLLYLGFGAVWAFSRIDHCGCSPAQSATGRFFIAATFLPYTFIGNQLLRLLWAVMMMLKRGFTSGQPGIATAPGTRLYRFAKQVFRPRTFKRVFEPVISDLQFEFFEALQNGRPRQARWIQIRGYWTFWAHVASQMPLSVWQIIAYIMKFTT